VDSNLIAIPDCKDLAELRRAIETAVNRELLKIRRAIAQGPTDMKGGRLGGLGEPVAYSDAATLKTVKDAVAGLSGGTTTVRVLGGGAAPSTLEDIKTVIADYTVI